jgi:hypothetical protein
MINWRGEKGRRGEEDGGRQQSLSSLYSLSSLSSLSFIPIVNS